MRKGLSMAERNGLGLSADQREALVRRMAGVIAWPHSDHHCQGDSAAVWQARAALAEVEARLVDLGVSRVDVVSAAIYCMADDGFDVGCCELREHHADRLVAGIEAALSKQGFN